jgi:hypothetical protein
MGAMAAYQVVRAEKRTKLLGFMIRGDLSSLAVTQDRVQLHCRSFDDSHCVLLFSGEDEHEIPEGQADSTKANVRSMSSQVHGFFCAQNVEVTSWHCLVVDRVRNLSVEEQQAC